MIHHNKKVMAPMKTPTQVYLHNLLLLPRLTQTPIHRKCSKNSRQSDYLHFNEDLEERAAATTVDHWGLTTYETQLTPSVNNGLRDVGSTIVGNQVILEYTPSVAGSGFYYYVPLTTDPIVDLAGNHLAEITAANKLPFLSTRPHSRHNKQLRFGDRSYI